jgi:hypothetical protein
VVLPPGASGWKEQVCGNTSGFLSAAALCDGELASGIEVDFVIDDVRVAIESKSTTRVPARSRRQPCGHALVGALQHRRRVAPGRGCGETEVIRKTSAGLEEDLPAHRRSVP